MSAPAKAAAPAGARERDEAADRDASRQAIERAMTIPGTQVLAGGALFPQGGPTEYPLGSVVRFVGPEITPTPVIDYGALGNVTFTPSSSIESSTYFNAADLAGGQHRHPHAG